MSFPPPHDLRDALFLDLDGTLAPIEATPDAVRFCDRRSALLARLEDAMDGALAILSGRTLEDIERILGDRPRAVAAVHGLVRRASDGSLIRLPANPGLERAREILRPLTKARAGLLLEDKDLSLAVHYRGAPGAADAVREAVERLAVEEGLARQDGDMVTELRTAGPDKGDAMRAFLAQPPFAGRRPVMVGDDLTDEHAFRAALNLGGFGILVGPPRPTAARYRLESADAVLAWLEAALISPVNAGSLPR